jgi:hypothetical protein
MGSYCRYCGHRCFVLRQIPGAGSSLHMATCRMGAEHDRKKIGYDYTTAINPLA